MRHPQTKVRPDLFEASDEVRCAYFDSGFVLRHDKLSGVFQDSVTALQERTGKHMIIAAGPTGVGKTTLAKRLTDYVYRELVPQGTKIPDAFPAFVLNFGWNRRPLSIGRSCIGKFWLL